LEERRQSHAFDDDVVSCKGDPDFVVTSFGKEELIPGQYKSFLQQDDLKCRGPVTGAENPRAIETCHVHGYAPFWVLSAPQ
jgi:hypothetical protein